MLMHKKLSAKSNEIHQDIISELPDEMLTQIISMLPASYPTGGRTSMRFFQIFIFSFQQLNKLTNLMISLIKPYQFVGISPFKGLFWNVIMNVIITVFLTGLVILFNVNFNNLCLLFQL